MLRKKILVLAAAAVLFTPALRAENLPASTALALAAPVADITAQEIFTQYIKAIGGAEALKAIKTLNSTHTMTVQGMALDVHIKAMAPNLESLTMSAGGTTFMKMRFDGTTGYQEQNGSQRPYTAEQLKEKADITGLFDQLEYLRNPAFKAVVKGMEKVKGADAYRVDVTTPSGAVRSEYYDVASKLLVLKVETKTTNGANVTSRQEFSNYQQVGKVLYPHNLLLSISTNGQEQVLDLKTSSVKFNEGVTAADFK